MTNQYCPLCRRETAQLYFKDRKRDYLHCSHCDLVFVPPAFHFSYAEERAYYDLHENDVGDAGYRRFLSRCAEPLLARLPAASRGLDFGCGPGPALAAMLEARGHSVALYDRHYANHPQVLKEQYDFICATEVLEHLHNPEDELTRLWGCLKPGGVMAIMTKLVISRERFANWHYKNDPTHIIFFSRDTLRWLACHWQAQLEFVADDVIFLTKP
ncbi:class I SAM-dependent methyltransferase [Biformimicrobium ophioploci]|nr:class I SAM-dependent methyltransferase [Microbulbifer sp. NKW57]